MWYLTSDNDDRVIYVVLQSHPIIIGRSIDYEVCNFPIPDDPSISRKHASLSIGENNLLLQDMGSRYGTFINNSSDKVEINNPIKLNANDIVKFGKMSSLWKVNSLTLHTCTSTLKGDELQKLKVTLSKLGAELKNEWCDSCNYLTMPAITLTIKVVLALVQGSNIVTTQFWSKLLESVTKFSALPDPKQYIPAVVESTLNKEVVSFSPNIQRKTIFKDKKFIFFSRRQYEMYKPVLIRSGAAPFLLSECKMTVSMLCEQDVIVIQYVASGATQETPAQRNQIAEIVTQLKNKGRRVIADPEIGLAILYCSTEKYCNPGFSFTSEVVKQGTGPTSKTSKVLAQESQEPSVVKIEKENVHINETYNSSEDKMSTDFGVEKQVAKRKLSEITSDIELNPNKKVATTVFVANIPNESSKRKLSDDHQLSNPTKKVAIDNDVNDQGSSNSSEDILGNNDKSDNMFNFINTTGNNSGNESKGKKLNLLKPQKRKLDPSGDSNGLFNFVQTDNEVTASGESSKQSIFSSNKVKREDDIHKPIDKKPSIVTPDEISAMRGVKLKELMESNSSIMKELEVKEENCDNLEEKMGGLDLGSTIVITCSDLIVKKEPSFMNVSEDASFSGKNFKKFKKVWPVRRQVTIIPPSSMSIANLTDSVAF